MKNKKADENISLEEIEKKLNEYKSNLNQVETLLDREKQTNPTKLNEAMKLNKELRSVIQYYEDLKKFKIQTSSFLLNTIPLTAADNGRICAAFYEDEKKWFNAIINQVDEKEQTAEITWLGYKTKETLPSKNIKVQEMMKQDELEPGIQCEAIYYEDGKWYNATIEQISEHGVHIKYLKYEDLEVVSFDSIRITPDQKQANLKRKELLSKAPDAEDEEFKIPDYLKITPADSEAVRLSKRKRVKSIKNKHKQEVLEKISKEKQDGWLNFAQKAPKMHKFGMKK
jgi:hypothetical protein